MAYQSTKMPFFHPEAASGGLNPFLSTPAQTAALGALHAAALGQRFEAEQQREMHEMKTSLGVLVELSARQAEQQELMRKQMAEQSQFMWATMQTVRQVQSQVNAMRNELIDLLRCNAAPAAEAQVRRRLESKRSEDDEPVTTSADHGAFAERVRARRGMAKTSAHANASSPPESPKPATPENPSLNPDMCDAVAVSESGRLDEAAVNDVKVQPSTFGFNRSPPGLCLYSEEVRDEAWISEVANEIKTLIIADDDKCVEAVRRTSPQVLNKTDHDGMTVFHYAAMHGNAKACEAIVSHVGFMATKAGDRNSNTAMHIATLHDQADVCHLILSHDPSAASVTNRYGDTPYDIAQRRGLADVCAACQKSQQC